MPSFADSIFLFVLALLLFGPKKLPVLARELGKWVGEFRRASNEFKMQMEDELRASEQAERQKQIVAMEAAAPIPPPLGEPAEEEHPHLRPPARSPAQPPLPEHLQAIVGEGSPGENVNQDNFALDSQDSAAQAAEASLNGVRPVPIATSGELHMMPPATGLPTPRGRGANPLGGGLLDAIPEAEHTTREGSSPVEDGVHEAWKTRELRESKEIRQETTTHGD